MVNEEISRRAKLLGFAKATRDTYIPKLTSSVSLLVGLYEEGGGYGGPPTLPADAVIALYPTYTRMSHSNGVGDRNNRMYHIDTNGWLSCPGLMTRKNRLIISLARQITRASVNTSNISEQAALVELKEQKQDIYNDSDNESIVSANSSTPPSSGTSDLLKERLSTFIARSIPNTELEITIGSEHASDSYRIVNKRVTTDYNGNFSLCVDCPYKPSYLRVAAVQDETIFTFQDILVIEDEGFGLISDIDDTVKLTGVCGDKRDLMRSLLLSNVSKWNIQTVVGWYDTLYKNPKLHNILSFHYVSNSPWQLFPTIKDYFQYVDLPPGSVHLKQYTGNIIGSLMEPKQSKKKTALYKILGDFPHKKFFCVGDSGEYDLEAYVDVAKRHPNQVLSIYIRYVQGSLSDLDEFKLYKQIRKLSDRYYAEEHKPRLKHTTTTLPTNPVPKSISREIPSPLVTPDLIDLDSRPGPMIPKKPHSLKGNQVKRKPPPPERNIELTYNSSGEKEIVPPLLPPRRAATSPLPLPDALYLEEQREFIARMVISEMQEIYPHVETFYELEELDKRGTAVISRVITALEALKGTNTQIRYFNDHDKDLVDNTLSLINEQQIL